MVIREMSGCSVGPTASESMLNPRRENRAAMRASTPGLFSTRTERGCLAMVPYPLVELVAEVRADVAGRQDLVVAGAGGDHGPDHGVLVHDEVDHDRGVVEGHRLLDDRVQVLGALAAQAVAAHRLGELD